MGLKPIWVFFIVIFSFFPMAFSEDEKVKQALVRFMDKLAPGVSQRNAKWGWNRTSDPCTGNWHGVSCDSGMNSVRFILLDESSLTGILDASPLCMARSLQILSLRKNSLHGLIPEDIGTCKSLTRLCLNGNNFSGDLPVSLAQLSNLKWLRVADNNFSGVLPDMVHVSGSISFHAENNKFTGKIPDFDFSKLSNFNVSNNNLQGPISDVKGKFHADSFSGNPDLCGKPLPNACPPPPPPHAKKDRKWFGDGLAIYSGYVILGVIALIFFAFKIMGKFKTKEGASDAEKKEVAEETSGEMHREASNEARSGIGMRSECSVTSLESGNEHINSCSLNHCIKGIEI